MQAEAHQVAVPGQAAAASRPVRNHGRRRVTGSRRFISDSDARGNIVTYTSITDKNVKHLRKALLRGAPPKKLPPLPLDVVDRIMDAAEYWVTELRECVKRKVDWTITADFIFDSVVVERKLKKLDVRVEFSAQRFHHSWRGGGPDSFAWGEVDILDAEGKSKLEEPLLVEASEPEEDIHKTQIISWTLSPELSPIVKKGDTVDFSFCSNGEGSCSFLIRYARMTVCFENQKEHQQHLRRRQ